MMLKIGQVAGALMMAAGVAAYLMPSGDSRLFAQLLLWGAVIYGACRLAAWFKRK